MAQCSVWALLLLLAWTPLPVGSNRPWSQALLVVAAAAVATCGALGLLLQMRRWRLPLRIAAAGLLACLVLGWIGVQARTGVPEDWIHPFWGEVTANGMEVAGTISLDPAETRAAMPMLAGCVLLFAVAFLLGQEERHAGLLMTGMVAIAAIWAAWGIVRFFGGWDLPFYPDVATTTGVSANFPNRSHFATYANLAFLLVVARLGADLLRPTAGEKRLRTAVADWARHLLEERTLWLLAGAVLLTAILGSTSRGGFLSLVVALPLLLALLAARSRAGLLRVMLGLLVAAGLAAALVPVAGQALLARLDQLDAQYVERDIEGAGRLAAWQVSTRLIAERPLLGHGYGAYASAFPRLADQRFHVFYDHAHNGYLEKAVELGLPATVALYAAVALAASLCLGYGGRPEPLPLAAAAGTVAVALHSLVDFSIQIPAVAVTYAVILGLGCGQAAAGAGQRGGRRSPVAEAGPGRAARKSDGRWRRAQVRDR